MYTGVIQPFTCKAGALLLSKTLAQPTPKGVASIRDKENLFFIFYVFRVGLINGETDSVPGKWIYIQLRKEGIIEAKVGITTAHEVGHALGLYHTFSNKNTTNKIDKYTTKNIMDYDDVYTDKDKRCLLYKHQINYIYNRAQNRK